MAKILSHAFSKLLPFYFLISVNLPLTWPLAIARTQNMMSQNALLCQEFKETNGLLKS